jgi:PAS domain-containing protein
MTRQERPDPADAREREGRPDPSASHESRRNDRLPRLFTLAVALTLLTLGALGWTTLRSYDYVTRQSPVLLRMNELQDRILLYDEVLTMSARMASATGDPLWEARYRQVDPQLDATLGELTRIAPTAAHHQATAQTHAANNRLVEMENRAFELVRQGQRTAALQLLDSDAYETQKHIYTAGMAAFNRSLRRAAAEQAGRSRVQVLWGIALIALSVPLLLLAWWRALGLLRRRQAKLELNNQRLDGAVALRTRELWEALTATKAANLRLAAGEEKYRHILETIQDGYFEIDLRGSFTLANPALAGMLGYPAAELQGMHYKRYTDPAEARRLFEAVNSVFTTGRPLQFFA